VKLFWTGAAAGEAMARQRISPAKGDNAVSTGTGSADRGATIFRQPVA